MDFWFFLLTYGGAGTLVGMVHARYDFKAKVADPEEHKTYTTGSRETHNLRTHTRTDLERVEACAASAARWGWVSAIFWPVVLVALTVMGITATAKNLAGGKELRAVRRAKAQTEIEAKAAQYAAEAKEAWMKLYGPDAPKDVP